MTPLRERLRHLTPAGVRALLAGLSADELTALRYDWRVWARPEQLPPDERDDWTAFLLVAGRGSGKTRSASEWCRKMAREHPGCRIGVIARTAGDVRDVCIEGESGLLSVHPPSEMPLFEPSKRRLTWRNGAQATTFSADEPDLLRGPQFHYLWADELAAWARLDETWSNARLALRLGARPRAFISTTPRPLPLLRELLASPTTIVRRGSTYDNAANLAPSALAEFRERYEGTRLGRQELHAEMLEDVEGSLFPLALLDGTRVRATPDLARIVVGVDPSVSATGGGDLCGISVCGRGRDGHLYVVSDLSGRYSPAQWAARVVHAYRAHHASRVIAEGNQGGALVTRVLQTADRSLPVKIVHARQGKAARCEPVAALFEQGRAHIVGSLPELETELSRFTVEGYVGGGSPDRADAMVWAMTELAPRRGGDGFASLRILAGESPERVLGSSAPPLPIEARGALHGGAYVTSQAELPRAAPPTSSSSSELQDVARARGWR